MSAKKICWEMLALLALCAIFYGRTLSYDYVWDDIIIFLNSNSLLTQPLSWKLLTTPILPDTSYMRPLVMLTWWAEFKLFHQNAMFSHAVNVAIFMVNVLLVHGITRAIITTSKSQPPSWPIPLIVAAVYATHPALIESTAWVSGRFDLLCTTGVLGAAYAFLAVKEQSFWRILIIMMFTTVALMSKELGVVTPAVLGCIWMAAYSAPEKSLTANLLSLLRSQRQVWVGSVAIFVVYFLLREYSMDAMYHRAASGEYYQKIISTLYPLVTLKFYLKIIAYPLAYIDTFYSSDSPNSGIGHFFGNLFVLLLVGFVLWSAFKKNRRWAWFFVASLVSIFLVLHFIPMTIGVNIAQDRFLTLPLSFFFIAFGLLPWANWGRNIKNRRVAKFVLLLTAISWVLLNASVTISAVPKWRSDLALWARAYQVNPQLEAVRSGFFDAASRAQQLDFVKGELERVREKNGGFTGREQGIYAGILFAQGNSESLSYYEGILSNLPPLDDHKKTGLRDFSTEVYVQYARSKMVFEGNLTDAYELLAQAEVLMREGREPYVLYPKAGVLLAMDKWEQGVNLLKALDEKFHNDASGLKFNLNADLEAYCKLLNERNWDKKPKVCVGVPRN